MSRYTTEVRFICEYYAGLDQSKGFNDIEDILEASVDDIFNFDFPFYDETRRRSFEKLILRNFYTREICEETVGLWKLRLQNKLNEIMPYFNMLYKSELYNFNPFYDTDLMTDEVENRSNERNGEINRTDVGNEQSKEKESGVNIGTSNESLDENSVNNKNSKNQNSKDKTYNGAGSESGTSSKTNDNLDLYSDTPQGGVEGLDLTAENSYLTNARKINDLDEAEYSQQRNESNIENISELNNGEENVNSIRNRNNNKVNNEQRDIDKEISNIKSNSRNETNTTKDESLSQYAKRVLGKKSGNSYSYLLNEFRTTFLRIDSMVLKELSVLFFGLWE